MQPLSGTRHQDDSSQGELLDITARLSRLNNERPAAATASPIRSATIATKSITKQAAIAAALARAGGGTAAQALAALSSEEHVDPAGLARELTEHVESATGAVNVSLQQVIFDPGRFVGGPDVEVIGTCVVLDLGLGRMDLSHGGAKLIVHIGGLGHESLRQLEDGEIGLHTTLCVTGVIKKQQRRTFMEAKTLTPVG
jgi:hypothetical protein